MHETSHQLGNMDRTWIIVERTRRRPHLLEPALGGERLGCGELRGAELVRVVVGLGVAEGLVRVEGRDDVLSAVGAAVGHLGLLCDGHGDVVVGCSGVMIWKS